MGKEYFVIETTLVSNHEDIDYIEKEYGIPYKKKRIFGNVKKGRYSVYEESIILSDNKEEILHIIDKIKDDDNVKSKDPLLIQSRLMNVYRVYSDGASVNNGRRNPDRDVYGSYGLIITKDGEEIHRNSHMGADWTNNYAELSGSLEGLKKLNTYLNSDDTDNIVIAVSDSQYVTKGCTEWMEGWIKRGWKNNEGKPTVNKELWVEMNQSLSTFDPYFRWIRGHTLLEDMDSILNEECDTLATELLRPYRRK